MTAPTRNPSTHSAISFWMKKDLRYRVFQCAAAEKMHVNEWVAAALKRETDFHLGKEVPHEQAD